MSQEQEMALHLRLARRPLPYAYKADADFTTQQAAIREKFCELLGMPEEAGKAEVVVEYTDENDPRFDEIRFHFESEPGLDVPCHLILPKERQGALPLVICLQGHSTGMHISLGRKKFDKDKPDEGDRDFAIQAIARGYAAVVMEQRGLGEQTIPTWGGAMCHLSAMPAFHLGRTLIGERTFDISRLIDALEKFDSKDIPFEVNLDMERIGLMGNSGGGTATYHASCLEPRIKVIMPSCAFNTYADSILSIQHCTCNFIPGIAKYMDMADLALMLAPRPLIIVNGNADEIFPIGPAKEAFKTVQAIYAAAGAPDNCHHVIGEGGHRFYAADSWPLFDKYI